MTTVLQEKKEQMKLEKLNNPNALFANKDQLWHTNIDDIEIVGNASFKIYLERPETGNALGGYIYLYEDSLDGKQILRKYWGGQTSGWSEKIDAGVEIRRGRYVVAYGPTYTVDVDVPATTVTLINGNAFDFQGSVNSPISNSLKRVETYYQFARTCLGFNRYNVGIVLAEGGKFGEGSVIQHISIDIDGPNSGVRSFNNLNLKSGQTYNVWIWMWNMNRPIAGYSFTLPK
ncbi:MAG: hypothetical protein JEZ14_02880 [Marinilabiliaceae bacterium]|nr:hypothetical protein [Marinilabiliaceae bacterium]